MSNSETSFKNRVKELRNIDQTFKQKPRVEKSKFAEHYIINRREIISSLLKIKFPNSSPILIKKLSEILQMSHYKRDYTTELIVEFLRNNDCKTILGSLLDTLTRSIQAEDELNKDLNKLNLEQLSPIINEVKSVSLGEFRYSHLASLWERIIAFDTQLVTIKERLENAFNSQRSEILNSKQNLEKFKITYMYGQDFVKLMEALYETDLLERVKERYEMLHEKAKETRDSLREILDFVSARATDQIQRETSLLNFLFLAAAIAECLALTQTNLGLWGLLPIGITIFIYFIIRIIMRGDCK